MYLQKNDLDIDDFLQAVGFVVPKNYNLEYFIVPHGEEFNAPEGSGAMKQPSYDDDTSIVYKMTPPQMKQDYQPAPPEYSIWEPGELGRRHPEPTVLPRVMDPSELQSPFVKVQESSEPKKIEFTLQERVDPFPAGTFFSCRQKSLREITEWWKENKDKVLGKDEEKKEEE